jgi:dTMP kinase
MTQAQAGRFITLEGGEGAGKSTQAGLLAAFLQEKGLETVVTREPGGTPGAEAIRALLVDGPPDRWDAWTEALLMTAARRDHIIRLIQPALKAGAWVICDRFADSTVAYQGAAGGLGAEAMRRLMAPVLEGCEPDLTLIIDLPVEEGLARAGTRGGGEDRFEKQGAEFHGKVRQGFLDVASSAPERCVVIDGLADVETVAGSIRKTVLERLF